MLVNRVRRLQKRKGLTQEALALKIGVSRQTIISIEKNKFIPGLDVALKISEALEVNIIKLFLFCVNEKHRRCYYMGGRI